MAEERMDREAVRSRTRRLSLVATLSIVLFAAIVGAFWHWDTRYALPTPRPPSLVQVPLGTRLPVDAWLADAKLDARGRPVHLHFFNPACPCSRFNLDHLHELVRRFGGDVFFVGVIESDPDETTEGLSALLADLGIPWLVDRGGSIAEGAGVYSTPQAVIVAADRALYYRGNYNTSRYCTDPRTEFARLALETLGRSKPFSLTSESPAYGCQLPSDANPRAPTASR